MSTEYSVALGQIIREQRKRKGIGLRELAREAEVSAGYLSEVESGKSEPTVSKIQRIAEALGVAITRLLPKNLSEKNS